TAFRRVDAPEPNTRSMNFQRVTVDDAARPTRSSANASGIDARISAANAAIAVLIMLPRRDPPCLYPVQQSSSLRPAMVFAALWLHPTGLASTRRALLRSSGSPVSP